MFFLTGNLTAGYLTNCFRFELDGLVDLLLRHTQLYLLVLLFESEYGSIHSLEYVKQHRVMPPGDMALPPLFVLLHGDCTVTQDV